MTEPLATILDRGKAASDVTQHFGDQLVLLRNVVNYGTNLVPRCFESSDKTTADIVILVALSKQLVTMLDGVELHVSNGALLASHVCTRALYEASLYVAWILKEDSVARGMHYYVWNLRQRRLWARRTLPGTSENAAFSDTLKGLSLFASDAAEDQKQLEALREEAERQEKTINELLNCPVYVAINMEFDRLRGTAKYDPPWYAPSGKRSIRRIADALGLLHEYDLVYSTLSDVTHASCFRQHVSVQAGAVVFEPIRNLEQIDFVLRIALSVTFRTYRLLLSHYRPGEIENFSRKYLSEWRDAFMSIKSVSYDTTTDQPC